MNGENEMVSETDYTEIFLSNIRKANDIENASEFENKTNEIIQTVYNISSDDYLKNRLDLLRDRYINKCNKTKEDCSMNFIKFLLDALQIYRFSDDK